MKPEKYDKLIDNMIAFGWHSMRCALLYILVSFGVGAIYFVFVKAGIVESVPHIKLWISGIAAIMTIMGYTFISLIALANKKYNRKHTTLPLRDIWLAWSTHISYYRFEERLYKECLEWINENIDGLYRSHLDNHDGSHFYFIKATDAMAFKIVWDEKCQKKDR